MSSGPINAWLEYDITRPDGITVCGLCNNCGVISTEFVVAFCICPNGRELKLREQRRKWGLTSVIRDKKKSKGPSSRPR